MKSTLLLAALTCIPFKLELSFVQDVAAVTLLIVIGNCAAETSWFFYLA
jgi:hypothetical protein